MKKLIFLLLIILVPAGLFGCQSAEEAIKVEANTSENAPFESRELLEVEEITHVEISKIKGIDPVIYEEAADLAAFDEIFVSAVKEPGIFNMGDPAFFIRVNSDSGEKQFLYLWIGNAGEQASLMREDDTHTLYSLSEEMTAKLAVLIEKEA